MKHDIKVIVPAIIMLIIYYIITGILFHEFCPMCIVTGLPCPGCGVTRALKLLITFQFSESLAMNPTAVPWLFFGIYLVWQRYIMQHWNKNNLLIAISICILACVWYTVNMIYIFPFKAPFTYYHGNLLSRVSGL